MTTARVDRAALVRRAMVELVAERGFHGTSMSQVAQRAGVATGTAYVHYGSKGELLIAAFVEAKAQVDAAVTLDLDLTAPPKETFSRLWTRLYEYLRADLHLARFLTQIDESPLRAKAHEALPDDDPLVRLGEEMADHLVDLPVEIIYELGLAPAARLAASDTSLEDDQVDMVIESCWRAIHR
ncbi:MAG: TetR/AcrR family transcriptional regulator [Actinomycetota bacterium]